MKKLLTVTAAALLALSLAACGSSAKKTPGTTAPVTTAPDGSATAPSYGSTAYDATVGGVRLAVREGFVEVVGADSAAAALTVPESYEGLPVTVIAAGALSEANAATLAIPASVTVIGDGAFSGALESITVDAANPNYASKDGILYTKDLSEFVFTPHVKGEVTISEGVKALNKTSGIRYGGKEWYDGITKLHLPKSLRSIAGEFRALELVTVAEGSTSLFAESGILYKKGSSSVSVALVPPFVSGSITVPTGMKVIPPEFLADLSEEGNTRVTSVILPDGITEIKADAFRGCRGLASINFPSGLATVRAGAFAGCALTEVSLPGSIRLVEKDAFDLPALRTLTVADGASGVSAFAFVFREGQYITMTVGGDLLSAMGKGIIDGMGTGDFDTLYYSFLDMVERLVISSGTTVGTDTTQLRALREIVFPSGMTALSDLAFAGCISLRRVVIPEGVTVIGDRAFNGCTNLASVTLPSTLRSVGTYAFARTAIVSLTLPASLSELGDRAFAALPALVEVYNLSGVDIGSAATDEHSLGACAEFVYTSASTPSKVTTDASGNLIYNGETVGYIGDRRVLDE